MLNINLKLLIFLNILYFLPQVCGCIILGVSIWIRVSQVAQQVNVCSHTRTTKNFAGVDLLIAVGSLIMVLGFLGCCGAIKESRCMLLLFFIGLLLILILQVTGGILGAVYRSQIEASLSLALQESVKSLQSSTEESKVFQEKLQTFQIMNQCCGLVNGPADWGKNFNTAIGGNKICECEVKDTSPDLCTSYQGRYIYK
ncbi:TSN8 protein, partial [Steatornis caripensis]|nr:TSN8 protein [Steatornis caripensis]